MNAKLRCVALTLIAALLLPTLAQAKEKTLPEPVVERSWMLQVVDGTVIGLVGAFDLLLLRPAGLVALGLGTAAVVPAFVLSAPGGRDHMKTALEVFVLEPGKYVFVRPVGDF
ncbi:MAG: hypothetical protein ACE5FL_07050 [Myxococcota bacterium]